MANEEHVAILNQGIKVWNQWRKENPDVRPDLSRANLREANLNEANFRTTNLNEADLRKAYFFYADLVGAVLDKANLRGANFLGADLRKASLIHTNLSNGSFPAVDLSGTDIRYAIVEETYMSHANLSKADMRHAILTRTNLSDANLCLAKMSDAFLFAADLSRADLSGVDLRRANLETAILVETNLNKGNITDCRVYGIAAWGLNLTDALQKDLIVTPQTQPMITVDNLEIAQFIYLLLHNEKIRDVIDNITSKAVLILGRFTPERKIVLDTLRSELRKRNFTPILFDFDKPTSRNLTETVSILAHMARFVIADITDAKSIAQELQRIVPDLPSLPVQPIIFASQCDYAMFKDFQDYPSVLPVHRYADTNTLLTQLDSSVISPALIKAKEIEERRKAWEDEVKKPNQP